MDLAKRYGCRYFVHLEDNEREILNRELLNISYESLVELPPEEQDRYIENPESRIHPHRHWEFLKEAAGCTVLIDRLKEHVPIGIPVQLFWPGYDECFSGTSPGSKEQLRRHYGISADQFVVLYTGAFHNINYDEICGMVTALKILVNRGMPLCFVKTGLNEFPDLLAKGVSSGWVKDLGFLPRERLPELYVLSDVMIQPGRSDSFNAYRFPSKLPEALAQQLPVILPHCNLGLALEDGVEALISHNDSMEGLIVKIVYLFQNPEKKTSIGRRGWQFCSENLNWEKSARLIESFYAACLSGSRSELSERRLIQTEATDSRLTSSVPAVEERNRSLRAPIAPKDLYQLFLEESRFKGDGTVLADGRTLQKTASPLLLRAQKKAAKYKRLHTIELIIILLLIAALYFHV